MAFLALCTSLALLKNHSATVLDMPVDVKHISMLMRRGFLASNAVSARSTRVGLSFVRRWIMTTSKLLSYDRQFPWIQQMIMPERQNSWATLSVICNPRLASRVTRVLLFLRLYRSVISMLRTEKGNFKVKNRENKTNDRKKETLKDKNFYEERWLYSLEIKNRSESDEWSCCIFLLNYDLLLITTCAKFHEYEIMWSRVFLRTS